MVVAFFSPASIESIIAIREGYTSWRTHVKPSHIDMHDYCIARYNATSCSQSVDHVIDTNYIIGCSAFRQAISYMQYYSLDHMIICQ